MNDNMQAYVHDFLYCVKLSLKIAIIPVIIGIVITFGYLIIKGDPIHVSRILVGIRNTGIIFSCAGLFICAAAFLQPSKFLRPLNYNKKWRLYFEKFQLVGSLFCISLMISIYFLIFDVVLWNIL